MKMAMNLVLEEAEIIALMRILMDDDAAGNRGGDFGRDCGGAVGPG